MNCRHVAVALAAAAAVPLAYAQMGDLKGKMKEGQYEIKMESEMSGMPGMPAGMGKQATTMQHCVTAKDIEGGKVGRPPEKDGKSDCEVKNFRMSGNTASYQMVCRGDMPMTGDTTMTFTDSGYTMNTKMAMNHGGQAMHVTQKMEGRYLGPCKK